MAHRKLETTSARAHRRDRPMRSRRPRHRNAIRPARQPHLPARTSAIGLRTHAALSVRLPSRSASAPNRREFGANHVVSSVAEAGTALSASSSSLRTSIGGNGAGQCRRIPHEASSGAKPITLRSYKQHDDQIAARRMRRRPILDCRCQDEGAAVLPQAWDRLFPGRRPCGEGDLIDVWD
jgi:hypothetical protein